MFSIVTLSQYSFQREPTFGQVLYAIAFYAVFVVMLVVLQALVVRMSIYLLARRVRDTSEPYPEVSLSKSLGFAFTALGVRFALVVGIPLIASVLTRRPDAFVGTAGTHQSHFFIHLSSVVEPFLIWLMLDMTWIRALAITLLSYALLVGFVIIEYFILWHIWPGARYAFWF